MARQYPRFLFSNPKNTKSEGPFIVHTLHPRIIMRVTKSDEEWEEAQMGYGISGGEHDLYVILLSEQPDPNDFENVGQYDDVIRDAHRWITSQIEKGFITL
jgi:hypothetical protein